MSTTLYQNTWLKLLFKTTAEQDAQTTISQLIKEHHVCESELPMEYAILNKIENMPFTECCNGCLELTTDVHAEQAFREILYFSASYMSIETLRAFFRSDGGLSAFIVQKNECELTAINCWEFIVMYVNKRANLRNGHGEFYWICVCSVLAYGIPLGLQRIFCIMRLPQAVRFENRCICNVVSSIVEILLWKQNPPSHFTSEFWTPKSDILSRVATEAAKFLSIS